MSKATEIIEMFDSIGHPALTGIDTGLIQRAFTQKFGMLGFEEVSVDEVTVDP